MKYCLSSRCSETYLNKAHEIKFEWRDRRAIPDYAFKYPDKDIILQFNYSQIDEVIDWEEINKYNRMCENRLICAVANIQQAVECGYRDIKFYYGFPIDSFYELNAWKDLGVCYVRLGPSLFFSMDRVKAIGIPVRAIPNVAYNDGLPRGNGVCGQWIRPEDIDLYEDYITTVEFENADIKKEEALYRIYREKHGWSGNLNNLITNLNYGATSRLIPQEITKRRLNCGHLCQTTGTCSMCVRAFSLAQPNTIKNYLESFDQT